jgi:soluble lytic murein transglycosylase-like protein
LLVQSLRMSGVTYRGNHFPLENPTAARASATALLLLLLASTAPALAETAVLENDQRISVTGYEHEGAFLRLHVAGGEILLPAERVVRIEPQEDFPPPPVAEEPALAESIRATATRHRLDPDLLASVIAIESRFDRMAVSRKNARGLMQLMPATSNRLGVADAFDARQNLEGGARYLREMLDRYGQNLRLALAAYNAGPGRVDRARGIPAIRETRVYVARVLQDWHARTARRQKSGQGEETCGEPAEPCGPRAATAEGSRPGGLQEQSAVAPERPAAPGLRPGPYPPSDPR